MRTVAVLGGSYAGSHAAELLAKQLPRSWRCVLIDRQSHFNHLYLFPRLGVLPAHAHKAFIPYDGLLNQHASEKTSLCDTSTGRCFDQRHIIVHAEIKRITDQFVLLDRELKPNELVGDHSSHAGSTKELHYDVLIYALGCRLPPPLISPSRTKQQGIAFLETQQRTIAQARSILILGGGALGLQYATDIADLYNNPANAELRPKHAVSDKKITLVHSRDRFLPLYKREVDDAIRARLDQLGIDVIMSCRPVVPDDRERMWQEETGVMRSINVGGRDVQYDLLLRCTGQLPNSSLLGDCYPTSLDEHKYIKVRPSLQIDTGKERPDETERNTFVIGDVAAAGVIKAGHTGWNQAEVAVANVLARIQEPHRADSTLQQYEKTPPQIKVTLGMRDSVSELLPEMGAKDTVVSVASDGPVEGYWQVVWKRMGVQDIGDALH